MRTPISKRTEIDGNTGLQGLSWSSHRPSAPIITMTLPGSFLPVTFLLSKERKRGPCLFYFHAKWAPPCEVLTPIVAEYINKYPNVSFFSVALDEEDGADSNKTDLVDAMTAHFNVTCVPLILLLKDTEMSPSFDIRQMAIIDRIEGFNPPRLDHVLKNSCSTNDENRVAPSGMDNSLDSRLKSLINQAPLVIFIKGSPANPQCGFTRQLLALLKQHNITDYKHFDILSDEQVRQGLKAYSCWPTYPQIYSQGQLVGGLDIVRELMENGSWPPPMSL